MCVWGGGIIKVTVILKSLTPVGSGLTQCQVVNLTSVAFPLDIKLSQSVLEEDNAKLKHIFLEKMFFLFISLITQL